MSEQKDERVIQSDHDLDQLEVRLLFLVEQPNQMHATTSFLIRRGWKAKVTKDAPEALRMISKEGFDYVLISVNHPNPKVAQLALLIPRTFNTPVVSIAEKADAKSIGLLNIARTAEKLLGRISGPAIHRKIRQLLSIKYGLTTEKLDTNSERSGDYNNGNTDSEDSNYRTESSNKKTGDQKDDYIRFKREADDSGYVEVTHKKKLESESDDEEFNQKTHSKQQEHENLNESSEHEYDNNIILQKSNKKNSELYHQQAIEKKKRKPSSKQVDLEEESNQSEDIEEQVEDESAVYIQKGANLKLATQIPKTKQSDEGSQNTYYEKEAYENKLSNPSKAAELYANSQKNKKVSNDLSAVGSKNKKNRLEENEESISEDKENTHRETSENDPSIFIDTESANDKSGNSTEEIKVERKTWLKENKNADLFAPIREAIEIICINSEASTKENKLPTNVIYYGVIPFDLNHKKYFMIICYAGRKEALEERIFDLYGEIHGLESAIKKSYKLGEPQALECMPTNFEDVVYNFGLASFTDSFAGIEMSVSIFERNIKPISLELEVKDSSQSKIKFENRYLKHTEKIDFTLYLNMPSQRIIKYIKPGGSLSEKQLVKLLKNSAIVFVDREDKDAIDKYMLGLEIEELILNTENKKAS